MSRHLLKRPAVQQRPINFVRTVGNTDLYNALHEAKGAAEIGIDVAWKMPLGYRLIRVNERLSQRREEIEIALVNDLTCAVALYVNLTIADPRHGVAVQNFTWRSSNVEHDAMLLSASQRFIFGYILNQYDLILSDSPRTGQGRYLWMQQVSKAIAEGFLVHYAADSGTRFEPVTTQAELNDLQEKWCTMTDDQSCHLALISKAPRTTNLLHIANGIIEVVEGTNTSV